MKVNFILPDKLKIVDDLIRRSLTLQAKDGIISVLPYKGKSGADLAKAAAQISGLQGLDLEARDYLCGVLLLVAKKEELLEDMETSEKENVHFWEKWIFSRRTLGVYAQTLLLPVIETELYFDESVRCALCNSEAGAGDR